MGQSAVARTFQEAGICGHMFNFDIEGNISPICCKFIGMEGGGRASRLK